MSLPALPEGMTPETWARVRALPERQRVAVLERAAILHYDAGLPWPEADSRAFVLELGGQRVLSGGSP